MPSASAAPRAHSRRKARRGGLLRRAGHALLGTLLAAALFAVVLVMTLRWVPPPTTAFMLEAHASARLAGDHYYRTQYQWVDFDHISAQAALAVVASEDQLFPYNDGFDFASIRAALQAHAQGARLRGASTITQQVAKNLFLWSGRSFARKGVEALFTVLLDTLWTKQRVLEVYLNIAQFGPGVFGVQAAARHFFHQSAAQLTRPQSALLAAVLPNPERLHVNAPSRYLMAQQQWILQQMDNLGGPRYLRTVEEGRRTPTSLEVR